jgi:mono/diheme cytochrome c family protein
MIVRRGMPEPPSFHIERLREAPDRHVMTVIAEGWGVMYGYAARIRPEERWAIVAYLRALQLSRGVPVAALPDDLRRRVEEAGQ